MDVSVINGDWQYFPREEIHLYKNNFLVSPCGTGKTTALKNWLQEHNELRVIVVTFRISLAYMLANTYGFENYLDFKHESSFSLAEHPRIVISVESLQKFFRPSNTGGPVVLELPDVLVLDEYCSIIEHAFNAKTLDPPRRSLFFTFIFSMLTIQNKTVIGADAFFDLDLDIDVFRSLHEDSPCDKYRVIVNHFRKQTRTIRIWQSPRHWKNYLLVTAKEAEKKIFFFVNNKTVSDAIATELQELKGKVAMETSYPVSNANDCLYLSSDSSPGDLMRSSIDPNSEWRNYKFVTVTPTIQAGVSFDVENHFDLGFGYAGLGSTQPLGVLQQLARVRNYTENLIELCVQKQSKGVVSRTPPSIEEVVGILERKTDGFNNRYLRCCEVNYTLDVQENVIRFGLVPKSIVNVFCIRVARADYFAKQNYLTALVVLAEKDSYDIKVMTPSESKKFTEKTIKDHRRAARPELTDEEFNETERGQSRRDLPSYQTSFPCTLRKHSIFKSEILFHEWDGCFNMDDKLTDAKSYIKTKNFIRDWNILGAHGSIDELISIDEQFSIVFNAKDAPPPPSDDGIEDDTPVGEYTLTLECDYPQECAKLISFNQSHVGDFYSRFVADDRQERFHDYITGNYRKMLKRGKEESNIGNSSNISDAIIYEFCVKLWAAFELCPMESLSELNWLGARIEKFPILRFRDYLDDLTHDEELESLNDQFYIQRMEDMIVDCNQIFRVLNEGILTNVAVCERIRLLFVEYWEHIYGHVIDLTFGGSTRTLPQCFTIECPTHNVAQTLMFIRIACDTVRETLRFIGLRINLEKKVTTRTASIWHHQGRRVRLSRYDIENFDERLMISYCRLAKDGGYRVATMTHYPRPDPFRLLFSDPMAGLANQNGIVDGYRFHRHLWAHPKMENSLVNQDLIRLRQYADVDNIVRAKHMGQIAQHENIMESIFPNLSNVRYFWYLLRIGTDNPLPLNTRLHTKFIKGKEEPQWYKYHGQSSDIDFTVDQWDIAEQQKTYYKYTGLHKYSLFRKTDEEIRKCINTRANNKFYVSFSSYRLVNTLSVTLYDKIEVAVPYKKLERQLSPKGEVGFTLLSKQ